MTGRRVAPLVIAVIGVALAILQYVLDNKDPLVFSLPILVGTGVIVSVLLIARGRPDDELERVREETDLRDGGVSALPSVTPILAGVRGPARVLTGRLPGHGPRLRITQVGDRLVAICETDAAALDEETGDWLVLHDLHPQAGVEDGLLVVAVPRDTDGRALVDLVAQVQGRLEDSAR